MTNQSAKRGCRTGSGIRIAARPPRASSEAGGCLGSRIAGRSLCAPRVCLSRGLGRPTGRCRRVGLDGVRAASRAGVPGWAIEGVRECGCALGAVHSSGRGSVPYSSRSPPVSISHSFGEASAIARANSAPSGTSVQPGYLAPSAVPGAYLMRSVTREPARPRRGRTATASTPCVPRLRGTSRSRPSSRDSAPSRARAC